MLPDLRQAVRAIARMPFVAAVVILSLAAGIGINTVVFSWIQAVVFKALPGVAKATSYLLVEPRTDAGAYAGGSWAEYGDMRERLTSFPELLAFRMTPVYVGASGRAERAYALLVSGNYFTALGLSPAAGRFLAPDEAAHPGGAPVAIVSYDYWQNKLGGRAAAVGGILRVNGRDLAIVGVAPRGFQGTTLGLSFDLWFPATLAPEILPGSRELTDRGSRGYGVMGLLKPGASRAQAQADVDVLMRQLAQAYPETNATMRAEVLGFSESPRGPQRFLPLALSLLQAAMLLLLLTVCGNTANLVLARASVRQREIGIRLSLGARPSRIVRLVLTENIVLGLAGALLGVAVAFWGTDALRTIPPLRGMPIRFQTSVDWAGLAFTIALGAGCGVIFGAAPAMQLAWMDPQAALRIGGRRAARSRLRDTLMAVQAGLAVVILIVAALFIRGLAQTRVDTGFNRDGVLLAAYDLTGRTITPASARDFADRVQRGARAIPGVEAAAISSSVPLDIHGLPYRTFTVDGRARADADPDQAVFNIVTPGYFALMGIPFVAGSDFAELTNATAPRQAIVNEAFVQRYLPGLEPLGRQVESRGRSYTIVGVVRTSLSNAFGEPPTAAVYYSYRDLPAISGEVHLRTRTGSEAIVMPDLRRVVAAIDPELPLYNVRTLSEHIETNLVFRRVPARLFAVLGPLMLILAAFGIYAVVAYNVSLRTTEIGVRMALGAPARRIVGALVGESLRIVGVGAMLGWIVILVVIVDVVSGGPLDVPVFAGVPLLLIAVAALACWLPARRAARIDPLVALRQD